MSRRRVEIAVGVFMLTGITVLLVSVIFIGRQQRMWEERVRVETTFGTVEGLQLGAPVSLAGIWVGSVEDITLNAEGQVRVLLKVRKSDFDRIREDSYAQVKTSGLVGDRYVDITVGSAESPAVPAGGAIPGIDPLGVNDVLAQARPVLENMSAAIQNIRDVTERLLAEGSDVNVILNNLRQITDTLAQGQGTIGRLLHEDTVYNDLRDTLASAKGAAANAEQLTATLRSKGPALLEQTQQAVDSVGAAATRAGKLLEQGLHDFPALMAGLERSVADLEVTLTNLRAASEDIRAATPQIPQILSEGQAAIDDGRAVLRAMQAHPLLRRYVVRDAEGGPPILVRDRAEVPDAP